MTMSQASMQRAQAMHSSWNPSRMSIPCGQTKTHLLHSMQRPASLASSAAARFAPGGVVLHQQGLGVGQRALEPGVGAEVVAELLPEPGQVEEPDRGEDADDGVLAAVLPWPVHSSRAPAK